MLVFIVNFNSMYVAILNKLIIIIIIMCALVTAPQIELAERVYTTDWAPIM